MPWPPKMKRLPWYDIHTELILGDGTIWLVLSRVVHWEVANSNSRISFVRSWSVSNPPKLYILSDILTKHEYTLIRGGIPVAGIEAIEEVAGYTTKSKSAKEIILIYYYTIKLS